MKNNTVFIVLLCMLMTFGPLVMPVAATEDSTSATTDPTETTAPDLSTLVPDITFDGTNSSVTHGCHTLDAKYPLHGNENVLTYSQSALLYEVNSGTMLYNYNPDQPMYPSSLVKVMTALIAMEQGNLDDTVSVSTLAVESIPKSALKVGLRPGEQMSLRNLIYCMIVGSGNDASMVIAEHIAGSHSSFVEMMNRRAAELGCTGTRFMKCHGLHDPKQLTTARDMARIMAAAIEIPEFMEIFGTARYSVPATNVSESRFLTTVNLMLDPEYRFSYYDSRVTGGRTGVTEDDKRCFVATAEDENCRYISVVLGATPEYRKDDPGRVHKHGSFEDTKTLLNMGFGTHDSTQILYKGQIVSQYSVVGGENDIVVGPNSDLRCIFPSDATSDQLVSRVQLVSNPIQAPVKEGDLIAVMQVWYGNVCLGQTDLLAKNNSNVNQAMLDQNSQDGRFDAGASSTAMIVLIVIGALIVGLSLGLLIMRRINGVKHNQSARRRRRSH